MKFTGSFEYQGRGQVVEDKLEDDTNIKVVLIEQMPTLTGDYNKTITNKVMNRNSRGKYYADSVVKSSTINAKWINIYNSNRASAPDVVIGEYVDIFKYGGNDEYFWASISTNMRKREKVVYSFSNMDYTNPDDTGNKAYYFVVDTINKQVALSTDDSDGEVSKYDIILDTQKGIFTIMDKQKNLINLESLLSKGRLSININGTTQYKGDILVNDYTSSINNTTKSKIDNNETTLSNTSKSYIINAPKFGVFGSADELIALIIELIDAIIAENHMGNLGILTILDGASTARYMDLKSRFSAFKVGGSSTAATKYSDPNMS